MPKVPVVPVGPIYRIPVEDEPERIKVTVHSSHPMTPETAKHVGKAVDAIVKEVRKTPKPRQSQRMVFTKKCTWCGGKVADADIHPNCAEARERMRARS